MPRRKPISPTVAPMYAESREPAASTSSTSPGGAREARRRRTRPRRRRRRRRAPSRARATARSRQRAAATGPYQRSHAARRARHEPLADAGDAHLLAGRRGGRRDRRGGAPAGSPARPRSSAARSTPGRHVEVSTVGSAKSGEQRERRMDRHQQRERRRRAAAIQPHGREQRHVHVVEHEHLVRAAPRAGRGTPGRSWCSIVATDACSSRDVRLERDRQPVAEAALRAVADRGAGTRSPPRSRRGRAPRRARARGARRARRRRAASARARSARRAAPRGARARTRRRAAAARPGSRASARATSRAARRGRSSGEDIERLARPRRPSPKRDACSSNIVR